MIHLRDFPKATLGMARFVTARAGDVEHIKRLRQGRPAACYFRREFDPNTLHIENEVLCDESHGVVLFNMV